MELYSSSKMADVYIKTLLILVVITSAQPWNAKSLDDSKINCDYNNVTMTLVIEQGFIEKDVINCFETYPETEILIFRNSRLKAIPPYMGLLKNLVSLDLSYNDISSVSFASIEQMCRQVKHLVLDYNDIRVLRKGDLDCLEALEKIYVSNNRLKLIQNGTFNTNLKSLDYIHLVNNSLTEFDSSLFSRLAISSNIHITVNASFNSLHIITNSANLTIDDFSRSSFIEAVLTHNNVTRVNTKYYFDIFNITHPFPQLLNLWNCGFDVRFNPFICDCALNPLAKALKRFYKMDPDNPVFSITCGSPLSLDGMMVRKVPPDQFNCSIVQHCPKACRCIKTIALDLITVDCDIDYTDNDLPMTCPSASKLQVKLKSDHVTQLSPRTYLLNVTVLDVSQCSIADIDPTIVEALESGITQSIYLNDNNLNTIPKTFQKFNFSDGQIMTIDGNPFKCDCHSLWLKKWILLNKKHIIHQDRIKCANGHNNGKVMVDVPDNEFTCESGLTVVDMIYIAVASVVGILILTSIIVCKINTIQVFMMVNFGICKYCFRTRKQRRLEYDIFIPHSCEDDATIDEIVNFLEYQPTPYKVCLAERNFKLGKTVAENILESIESSHTTLFVISNNFLRSAWCNMEFREAHMRFLRDRNINMVLIVLEELDKEHIYKELRLYLQTHVYLKFTDRHFWAKLLRNIPIMISNDAETDPLLPN